MKKRYLISGIGISNGGVGRLMQKLEPAARARGYGILSRKTTQLRPLVRKKKYVSFFYELISGFIDWIIFTLKIRLHSGDTILVLHPQRIGYSNFLRLVKSNNVYLYVMDNSFFCIMSYNYYAPKGVECLQCVGNPDNSFADCFAWPSISRKQKLIDNLKEMMQNSDNITFLAQTYSQASLLKAHFGPKIKYCIVGMEPIDLSSQNLPKFPLEASVKKYDIVYHGSSHLAKGIKYFLQIAKLLPDLKIFIPISLKEASLILSDCESLKNVTFKDCDWERGLEDAVRNAKVVVNPSLWSAPIEGAFLKSLAYNGNVATVTSKYGYSSEAPIKNIVLELPRDPAVAAKLLERYVNNGTDNSKIVHRWLVNFRNLNTTDKVFDAIEKVSDLT